MKTLPSLRSALVVDDEPSVLITVSLILKRLGFETITAESGRAAFAIFNQRPIDLIVTDFSMPEMTGLELAVAIRERAPRVPIIMLSALAQQLKMQPPLPAVDKLLNKPTSLEQLTSAVAELLPGDPAMTLSVPQARPPAATPQAELQ